MNDLFAFLYEVIIYVKGFSQDLYNENTYAIAGLSMVLISLMGVLVYYYVINHPKFNRWFHWLITIGALCLINFGIAYALSDGVMYNLYGEGSPSQNFTNIIGFGFANALWTFIFSFIFSMCLKWKSTNAKHSPF